MDYVDLHGTFPPSVTYKNIYTKKLKLVSNTITTESVAIDINSSVASAARLTTNTAYGCNKIYLTANANREVSSLQIWVTKYNADYDLGVGKQAYHGNLAANTDTPITLTATSDIFSAGDGAYRIGLYAKSALDGTWDVQYLFITIDNENFELSDGSLLDVVGVNDSY